jgi:hypothetical protein
MDKTKDFFRVLKLKLVHIREMKSTFYPNKRVELKGKKKLIYMGEARIIKV